MECLKIKLDPGAYMPERAHVADAGLDLRAMEDATIGMLDHHIFNTGVHVEIPEGYVGMLTSKSGLMAKHHLTSDGTIDSGYTGAIQVALFNHGLLPYTVHKGDKISQLVIYPIVTPELELVDFFKDTERGDNGFGSTGK